MAGRINRDLHEKTDGTDHALYKKILGEDRRKALFQAILELRNARECEDFFADLWTPREHADFEERWLLARLLDLGHASYRDISAETGASTTTVGRVARFLQQEAHKGYRLVLDRIGGVLSDDTPGHTK